MTWLGKAPAPRFSIVVPLYNKERYVEQTLATVLQQTFGDFEVLVIDDGSTDDGPQRVAAIDDPRLQLHRVRNAGVSCARNHGINLARGEWVAFLDADDWLHERYLETLDRLIRTHPTIDVVGTRYRNVPFDALLQPVALHAIQSPEAAIEIIDDLPRRWLQAPVFFTSSVAVRRARLMLLQPCFPESESFGEDLDLWFRLSAYSSIALHAAPLVWRFIVPGSLTSVVQHPAEPAFLQRLLREASANATPSRRRRSLRRFVRISRLLFAREAIVHGRQRQAMALLCRSFALHEPRWWLTALLLLAPPSAALRWHGRHNPPLEPLQKTPPRA